MIKSIKAEKYEEGKKHEVEKTKTLQENVIL